MQVHWAHAWRYCDVLINLFFYCLTHPGLSARGCGMCDGILDQDDGQFLIDTEDG